MNDSFDVFWLRAPSAEVHCFLVYNVRAQITRLEEEDSTSLE